MKDKNNQKNTLNNYFSHIKNNSFLTCRICFEEENRHETTMISPCECKGSVRYVHLECIEKWLQLNYKLNYCELCKHEFRMKRRFKPILKWNIFLDKIEELLRNLLLTTPVFIFTIEGICFYIEYYESLNQHKLMYRLIYEFFCICLILIFIIYLIYYQLTELYNYYLCIIRINTELTIESQDIN